MATLVPELSPELVSELEDEELPTLDDVVLLACVFVPPGEV